MESIDIFTLALGLKSPWRVSKAEFVTSEQTHKKELHLTISYERGYQWSLPDGSTTTAYDTQEKTWRHLNFFQHECYIHCNVPRIRTGEHTIEMVSVPWSRQQSGFTLLFEAYQMLLIEEEMPVSNVSRTVGVTEHRIWRVFAYWLHRTLGKLDLSAVKRIGVDETSSKKGHRYITHFVDLDTHNTIFVCEGKEAETFRKFQEHLVKCGGDVANIELISMDMSVAFQSGAMECFPDANIVFDKFHIVQAVNAAMDEVRKAEKRCCQLLKKDKYALLHSQKHLSEEENERLVNLLIEYPILGRAYGLKESFMDVFDMNTSEDAKGYLAFWIDWTLESGIQQFVKFARMIQSHWKGIAAYFDLGRITNGVLEGLNSKIQLAKRRARGFRNIDNFILMVYYLTGKLKICYPHEMA